MAEVAQAAPVQDVQEAHEPVAGAQTLKSENKTEVIHDGIAEKNSTDAVKTEALPTADVLAKVYELKVQDKDGKEIKFGTLVRGNEGGSRNIIVFIRHFFCGLCQEYIRALEQTLPISTLSALNPPTTLTIIGNGSPTLIQSYIKETSCPYPIYADPTRQLYQALDLNVSLAGSSKRPEYITVNLWQSTWTGIKQGLKAGLGAATKSGKISQNGGEYIWVDGELTFVHKMKNTMDHLEVKDLEKLLQ